MAAAAVQRVVNPGSPWRSSPLGGVRYCGATDRGTRPDQACALVGPQRFEGFFQGLRELRYVNGQTITGGLMAYDAYTSAFRAYTATYVDKILKGAKPSDLPVEQATKFELVINAKAAKALGLTIPASLLNRADEVLQ